MSCVKVSKSLSNLDGNKQWKSRERERATQAERSAFTVPVLNLFFTLVPLLSADQKERNAVMPCNFITCLWPGHFLAFSPGVKIRLMDEAIKI